jgi:type II secretory pathway component PulJ
MNVTAASRKQNVITGVRIYRGYVLLEIIIALGLFAAVAVSLVKALHMTSQTASVIQQGMLIDRVLRSAMTEALSNPYLEEGTQKVSISELTGDEESLFSGELETTVEPLELENEDGQLLQNMYRIEVVFYWRGIDGEWQEQRAETWRYANLYRP